MPSKNENNFLLTRRGFNVESIWECEWKEMRKREEVKSILDELRNKGVITGDGFCGSSGILPRDALYGGRTGNNSVYQSLKRKPYGSRLRYYDIKSLYPDVMRNEEYPVGFPEVKRKDFDYSINAYFGLMKVDVTLPTNLFHPFLPYRIERKNEKNYCFHCVERARRKIITS